MPTTSPGHDNVLVLGGLEFGDAAVNEARQLLFITCDRMAGKVQAERFLLAFQTQLLAPRRNLHKCCCRRCAGGALAATHAKHVILARLLRAPYLLGSGQRQTEGSHQSRSRHPLFCCVHAALCVACVLHAKAV